MQIFIFCKVDHDLLPTVFKINKIIKEKQKNRQTGRQKVKCIAPNFRRAKVPKKGLCLEYKRQNPLTKMTTYSMFMTTTNPFYYKTISLYPINILCSQYDKNWRP